MWRLSQAQGHSVAGWIMSMKYSNDTIGNRTHELQACSTEPQPTAPPRAAIFTQPLYSNVQNKGIFY